MNRVSSGITWIEGTVSAVGIVLIAVGVALEAVLRIVFNTSVLGLEQMTIIVGVYTYYMSAALASNRRSQIRVTILQSISLSPRTSNILGIIANLVSSIVCFMFAYYAFRLNILSFREHIAITPLGWSYVIISASLFLGLLLMGIHHLTQLITTRGSHYWDSEGGH